MHLKQIKLRGFKSFPESVDVRLEPGVAVVVGPNGSGKSNVSDAILWATGVMSPSDLRAEKPDDVLFAGSTGAKPVDFAEVELVFDNEDGGFGDGLEFSEISVARRLHRGGEGQYLVNRAAVRRLDLIELLADVGLGGGLRSVISQGRVESVLNSKPGERRELIEQAAGLGRFKSRRHRAELKLARVGIQVERARDVEAEVRKRLRPLALQATAAERAEKLAAEIARVAAAIATLDLAALDERFAEAQGRRQAAALARRDADAKLESVLSERNEAEEELADAAGGREGATAALYRLRSAGERLGLRREAAQGLLATLRGELAAAGVRERGAEEALERAVRETAGAARVAEEARRLAAGRARSAYARVAELERAAQAEVQARLDALLAERAGVESELAGAAGGREEAAAALLKLEGARDRLAMRRESAQTLLEQAREELAEAQAVPDGPRPEQLEAAADDAEAAARTAVRERDTLAERARAARERLETLERSLAEREGIPPAARALAEEGETLVLSALEVEAGQERAVAAALGPRASALLAGDAEGAFRLLERAREAGLGSLLVLVGRRPDELLLPVVPRERLLASKVPAVTAEGYGYDPARGELWFAGEAAEAVLLELDARRRALVEEAAELDRQATAAAQEAERAEAAAKAAASAYAEVAHLRRARPADPAALARIVAAAERLDALLAADLSRFSTPFRERAEAGGAHAGELGEELRRLGGAEAEARRELAESSARAAGAEQAAARLAVEPVETELPAEAAERELEAAAAAADEARQRARAAADAYDAAVPRHLRDLEPERLAEVAARAERFDETLVAAAAAAARFEAPLQAKVDAGAQRATQLAARLRELGQAEADLRRAAGEAGERAAAVDVELARIDAEADEARRRLEAAGAEPAEGEDRGELAATLARLERRREQIGQVNPLAKEEYDAEKERLEELAGQREDLERSLQELEQLRDDLTRTVEQRFAETFDAVQRHFAEVAETLFPGGEGRLRLVAADDDEESEPGVEVELRPAGKKVQRLTLLSGGEKALGAIAFLFSLFLARPAPFYLLDEVEAALDDANIGRFVELLRRYADRAQFIVITHQKRTMEAADLLYGVTMRDGVSQIISRRLPREATEAAGAA